MLARRYGPRAVTLLLATARAWLADPANERKRAEVVDQLDGWSRRVGGGAGGLASRLAREITRRKDVSPATWERELMSLRYEIVDMSPGAVREAALEAYTAQAWAGVSLVGAAPAARTARVRRRIVTALGTESELLRTERLSHEERRRATEAVETARAACYRPDAARLTPAR